MKTILFFVVTLMMSSTYAENHGPHGADVVKDGRKQQLLDFLEFDYEFIVPSELSYVANIQAKLDLFTQKTGVTTTELNSMTWVLTNHPLDEINDEGFIRLGLESIMEQSPKLKKLFAQDIEEGKKLQLAIQDPMSDTVVIYRPFFENAEFDELSRAGTFVHEVLINVAVKSGLDLSQKAFGTSPIRRLNASLFALNADKVSPTYFTSIWKGIPPVPPVPGTPAPEKVNSVESCGEFFCITNPKLSIGNGKYLPFALFHGTSTHHHWTNHSDYDEKSRREEIDSICKVYKYAGGISAIEEPINSAIIAAYGNDGNDDSNKSLISTIESNYRSRINSYFETISSIICHN